MRDRTPHLEIESIARARPADRAVRRSGAPIVELALDLQRRAGNRSMTDLVRHTPGAHGRTPTVNPWAALVGTRPVAAAHAPAPGVQREPCADCPDAPAPSGVEREPAAESPATG